MVYRIVCSSCNNIFSDTTTDAVILCPICGGDTRREVIVPGATASICKGFTRDADRERLFSQRKRRLLKDKQTLCHVKPT